MSGQNSNNSYLESEIVSSDNHWKSSAKSGVSGQKSVTVSSLGVSENNILAKEKDLSVVDDVGSDRE